jgi:hypothetical protein
MRWTHVVEKMRGKKWNPESMAREYLLLSLTNSIFTYWWFWLIETITLHWQRAMEDKVIWGGWGSWASHRKLWVSHRNYLNPICYPWAQGPGRLPRSCVFQLTFPGLTDSQPDCEVCDWGANSCSFLVTLHYFPVNSPMVQLFFYLHRKEIYDSFWKSLWMPGPLSWLLAQSLSVHKPGRKPSHLGTMMQQLLSPPGRVVVLTQFNSVLTQQHFCDHQNQKLP